MVSSIFLKGRLDLLLPAHSPPHFELVATSLPQGVNRRPPGSPTHTHLPIYWHLPHRTSLPSSLGHLKLDSSPALSKSSNSLLAPSNQHLNMLRLFVSSKVNPPMTPCRLPLFSSSTSESDFLKDLLRLSTFPSPSFIPSSALVFLGQILIELYVSSAVLDTRMN